MVVYYTHWWAGHGYSPKGGFLWNGCAPYEHSKVLLRDHDYMVPEGRIKLRVTVTDNCEVLVEEI